MDSNTLTESVARYMPNGWTVEKDKYNRTKLLHSETGASISLYVDSYRKTAKASCNFPNRENHRYSHGKEKFMYDIKELKDFNESIGFSPTKEPLKIAYDIMKRLLSQNYVTLYAACQKVVEQDELKERQRLDVLNNIADEFGLRKDTEDLSFDLPYHNDLAVDISGEVNYNNCIDLKIKGLTEAQTKQLLTVLVSFKREDKEDEKNGD